MRIEPSGVGDKYVELSRAISDVSKMNVEAKKSSPSSEIRDFIDDFGKKIKKFREVVRGELRFEIDEDTDMIIVKIKDKDTGEVIRQIPSEVVVKLAKAIEEFLGMILDERV